MTEPSIAPFLFSNDFVLLRREKSCDPDTEPDESFKFEVRTISFQLPRVRLRFDVSPPPPPPINLVVYEKLVALDQHGFQMTRSHLEDFFPRLSDVATSSIGASVGSWEADFTVRKNVAFNINACAC